MENTLVNYMGDNGFHFGEQGLIDKRTAYEASMRVPMLAYAPGLIKPGTVVKEKEDPLEMNNLIRDSKHQSVVKSMNKQLFDTLQKNNGMYIPIYTDKGAQQNLRSEKGKRSADFHEHLIKSKQFEMQD